MEKYEKYGVIFYPGFNFITGKKFYVACKNGYDILVNTEEEAFEKYKNLGM